MNYKYLLALICVMALQATTFADDKTLRLEDLNLANFQSGWKQSLPCKSVSGGTLTVAGTKYGSGVGTHAPSNAKILLHGTAKTFQAWVGVDDASNGTIEFMVRLDGELIWQSGRMEKGDPAKEVKLQLQSAEYLDLIVTDGGNGKGSDHANWCDATITYSGKRPEISLMSAWKWITPETELKQARAALIPYPAKAAWQEGTLSLNKLGIVGGFDKAQTAQAALKRWADTQGIPCKSLPSKGNVFLKIGKVEGSDSPEAYALTVSRNGVVIVGNDAAGLFYGVQTLRQLARENSGSFTIPHCRIVDYPAFGIRGFMHDVGRNFISVEELKKQIDMMALYKLNVFHFHPTENEGYRVESKKYPELNKPDAMTRWKGKFYTAEELKDLVAYCQERHMTVLPELDMPGHSAYFDRAFGFGMQTDDGVRVLKELVDEWVEIFPGPWFHLGTDEVGLTRETFVEEMTKYVRAKGKMTISWHHGLHPYDGKTIHQCWNAERANNPIIDSVGYINTDDPIMQVRNYFFRQYCQVAKEDDNNLGGILCYWPDEPVVNEDVEMRIAPVYPAIAAFGERIWQGNPNDWPVLAKEISFHGAPSADSGRHRAYAEFERRLKVHRETFFRPFRPEHFPFVKNADVRWKTIGPFPNHGNADAVFGPEKEHRENYLENGKKYEWGESWGGTISFKHLYGLPETKFQTTHTAYAVTYVHSDSNKEVFAWINFSRKYLAWPQGDNPKQGDWACEGSRIWINGQSVAPPEWEKPGRYKAPVTEESYIYRKPMKVSLNKGWNTVMMKSTNKFSPWSVTFLPIEWDGKGFREVKGLKYSSKK